MKPFAAINLLLLALSVAATSAEASDSNYQQQQQQQQPRDNVELLDGQEEPSDQQQQSATNINASGNDDQSSGNSCRTLISHAKTDFNFVIHRNGEPEACGETTSSRAAWEQALRDASMCDKEGGLDKYELEAVMTTLLANMLTTTESSSCGSTDNSTAPAGLVGYCDMGPNRTVIQEDHDRLVRTSTQSLPCRFYTREGLRIASMEQLHQAASSKEECSSTENQESCAATASSTPPLVHLYAVPAGRVFMFTPTFVGEEFHVTHVGAPGEAPVVLETLSVSPRVFEIHNFFTELEAEALIEKALNETSETMGLHRSTTGSLKAVVNSKRTSDNAWDQTGKTAMRLKRRCMETLGFDEYEETLTDGLQVLRYRTSQAYNSHPDYLSDVPSHWYDYDSAGTGANRFATVLLYMSDVDERDGGETMFTNAWPHNAPAEMTSLSHQQEIELFRTTSDAALFKEGSWEEALTAMCRRRLSVKPRKGKAVLFYSQLPDGKEDKMAIHAACPVMRESIKWAANLWVWSGPRAESKVAPRKWPPSEEEVQAGKPVQLQAYFYNSKNDPAMAKAELFYGEGSFWSKIGPGESSGANTFKGHEWTIQVDGKVVQRITITDEAQQSYHI